MLDWVTNTVASMGYVGITLMMLLENLIPPIPSEIIMPLAGFTAAQGKLNFAGVVAAGIVGSILGALPWYYAGWYYGRERLCRLADRYGRWVGISGEEILGTTRWFGRHGGKAVLIGRIVPTARTLISVPAGIASMPLVPFLIFTTIGTAVWTTVLTTAGYLLQANWQVVEAYIGLFGTVTLTCGAVAVAALVLWRRRQAALRSSRAAAVSD